MTVGPRIPAVWTRLPKISSISLKQFSSSSFLEITELEESNESLLPYEGSLSLTTSSTCSTGILTGEHEREIDPSGGVRAISGKRYIWFSGEALGKTSVVVIPGCIGTTEYPIIGTVGKKSHWRRADTLEVIIHEW